MKSDQSDHDKTLESTSEEKERRFTSQLNNHPINRYSRSVSGHFSRGTERTYVVMERNRQLATHTSYLERGDGIGKMVCITKFY